MARQHRPEASTEEHARLEQFTWHSVCHAYGSQLFLRIRARCIATACLRDQAFTTSLESS